MQRPLLLLLFIVSVITGGDLRAQWVECNVPFTGTSGSIGDSLVTRFAVSGTNVVAGASGGIYRSSDSGISWETTAMSAGTQIFALAMIDTNIFTSAFSPFSGSIVVYRSTNSGVSWVVDTSGLSIPSDGINNYIAALASIPNGTGGATLFAGAAY